MSGYSLRRSLLDNEHLRIFNSLKHLNLSRPPSESDNVLTVIASSRIVDTNRVVSTIFLVQGIVIDDFEPLGRLEIRGNSPGWKTATWWITNKELCDRLDDRWKNERVDPSKTRFFRGQPMMCIVELSGVDCTIIKLPQLDRDMSLHLANTGSTMVYRGGDMNFQLRTDDNSYLGENYEPHVYRQSNNYMTTGSYLSKVQTGLSGLFGAQGEMREDDERRRQTYNEVKRILLETSPAKSNQKPPSSEPSPITISIHNLSSQCELQKVNRRTQGGQNKKVKKVKIGEKSQESTLVLLIKGENPNVILPAKFNYSDPLTSWTITTQSETDRELVAIVDKIWNTSKSNSSFHSNEFEMAEFAPYIYSSGSLKPLELSFEKTAVRIKAPKTMRNVNLQVRQWCHEPRPVYAVHSMLVEDCNGRDHLDSVYKKFIALNSTEKYSLIDLWFVQDFLSSFLDESNLPKSFHWSTMGLEHFLLPKPNQLGLSIQAIGEGCLTLGGKNDAHLPMAKHDQEKRPVTNAFLFDLMCYHEKYSANL